MSGHGREVDSEGRTRLAGWKRIARHLGRDERTVMRWERERGMPVHRVPGAGPKRPVFAYRDELDAWLQGAADLDAVAAQGPPAPPAGRRLVRGAVAALAVGGLGLATLWAGIHRDAASSTPRAQRVELESDAVVARASGGMELWRFRHPDGLSFDPDHARSRLADIDGAQGEEAVVFVPVVTADPLVESAELFALDGLGRLRWRRAFQDTLRFGVATYSGPWSPGDMDLRGGPRGSVAWTVRHSTWWPSAVIVTDAGGHDLGTFVHAGWINRVRFSESREGVRVLAGGISNSHRAAVLAVLDAARPAGASPEELGSPYRCTSCPDTGPLWYAVFPPTDVTTASELPYNQVVRIGALEDRIEVQVRQGPLHGDADWVYTISLDLQVVGAEPTDVYWLRHEALEASGALDHTVDACPFRRPHELRTWSAERGWEVLAVPAPR